MTIERDAEERAGAPVARPLGKLVWLRARIRTALAALRSAVNEKPPMSCNTKGCGAEPAVATYIITATPEGHTLEGYVFCRECYLVHTGQKAPAVITPPSPNIIRLTP